ncbi:MAG: TldD/PmbA family protein [Candidatus Eisenbacteria bacterium]
MQNHHWGRPDGTATSSDQPMEATFQMVKDALQRNREVSAWTATLTSTRSRQLYLIREDVESERSSLGHAIEVDVHTRNGSELGRASFSLGPGDEGRLEELMAQTLAAAKKSSVPDYSLPAPHALPVVETSDREIVDHPRRALERLRSQLSETLASQGRVKNASAEFFVHHDVSRMETSTGVLADLSGTRSTAEIVLLGTGRGGREAEVQGLRYRRTVDGLDLPRWVTGLAEESQDAGDAETMSTWKGPVVLRADVANAFFRPVVQRITGDTVYRKMSPFEIGSSLTAEAPRGDRLDLSSDRTLPFGAATAPCDAEGVPAFSARLIEGGTVKRFVADSRYAHYLGIEPTGDWSNLVIAPGRRSADDFLRGEEVLEVVRFSWFTPSFATGDFASEMRLGYLHRGGRRRPIKGGAVTGNVFANLEHAFFSRELEFIGDGEVPRYLRLEDVEVVGS